MSDGYVLFGRYEAFNGDRASHGKRGERGAARWDREVYLGAEVLHWEKFRSIEYARGEDAGRGLGSSPLDRGGPLQDYSKEMEK